MPQKQSKHFEIKTLGKLKSQYTHLIKPMKIMGVSVSWFDFCFCQHILLSINSQVNSL